MSTASHSFLSHQHSLLFAPFPPPPFLNVSCSVQLLSAVSQNQDDGFR